MNDETLKFVLVTTMELATLAAAYLGVRLYNQNWKWRMAIIGIPLLADTLLYIYYRMASFFYLAVVLAICIPFVWPRKSA